MLEFRILGPLEVVDERLQVSIGGPKQRSLLAILLLHRGEAVTSERLIDELWLSVEVRAFPIDILFAKLAAPHAAFDLGWGGWLSDYPDPEAMLNYLLDTGKVIPSLKDPRSRAQLAAAARLTGEARYLAYGRLDAHLARKVAPLVAWGNSSNHELFSKRIGCQMYGVYGVDLAALCVRPPKGLGELPTLSVKG